MSTPRPTFPFTAIVGQETLKTALLINAVDPRVGGVLIRGEKGTAKSTAVRALAMVLPPIDVVEGCRFSCDPGSPADLCEECRVRAEAGELPVASRRPRVVDLPVSATEDRLVGTLDIEAAIKRGERRFEAGLLAAANRGILYVDEVNLLDDHLVDTLLDSAAMGVNHVEREGIAFEHSARFMLVGTMNPEEGDVRPQLLDRFGLCADVVGLSIPADRVEVLERRQAHEDDAKSFRRKWDAEERSLEASLKRARDLVRRVKIPRELLFFIATVCSEAGVDGHRADLTMARAAGALAALDGRLEATVDDARRIASLVLAHRMHRRPFDDVSIDQLTLDSLLMTQAGEDGAGESEPTGGEPASGAGRPIAAVLRVAGEPDASAAVPEGADLVAPLDRMRRAGQGRRQESRSDDGRGRYTRSEEPKRGARPDVAVDATIRTAASRGRAAEGEMAVEVRPEDVRSKVRTRRVGASVVFCVDGSGSMGAASRMDAAKAAIMQLLVDAYQRRDRVGLVSFRGEGAEVLLTPTSSVELANLKLRTMPTGGATPLAAGIRQSLDLLAAETRRDAKVIPWLVLVTDGRANVGLKGGLGSEDAKVMAARAKEQKVHTLVVDTSPPTSAGASAREIARLSGAEYVRLPADDGTAMAGAIKERLEAV
ncbi:MAG: magnesium chelatase subunit D family protein [Coriobacteriia bacterium]|nr:magnesium chelatase subunit D family protein [Coriobacteriia bacterium]